MLSFVTKRIEHVQFLLGESRWGLVLLVCWLLLGLFLLIRTSLFPISWQQETTVPFVPDISSDFWTSIFILLLFAAIVEGSYQATGELQERINGSEVKYSHRHEIPEIQDALRSFVIQGTELMSRCKDQTSQVSLEAIMEWDGSVENYIRRKLDLSFLTRFKTCSAWPTISARLDFRDRYLATLKTKLSLLQQFDIEVERQSDWIRAS